MRIHPITAPGGRLRPAVTLGLAALLVAAAGCGTRTADPQFSPSPGTPAATTAPPNTSVAPPAAPAPTATTPTSLPTARPSPPAPRAGTWRLLPPGRQVMLPASVWTGRQLLVVGAAPHTTDTQYLLSAYTPATNSWRRLAAPPPVKGQYEGKVEAVWTGREMIAWGSVLSAAYNPARNSWRKLPPTPPGGDFGPGNHAMIWTGRQVLIWGGGCCGGAGAGGGAYTPATNSWQLLPPAPLAARYPAAAWTGHEMIITGGNDGNGTAFRDAAAYNPTTRTWRRLPAMPAARAQAVAVWDGTEVLVVGGRDAAGNLNVPGLAYSPRSNRWRTLPAGDAGRAGHVAVWTGRQLLVWGGYRMRNGDSVSPGHGMIYDPAANRWSAMPVSPLRARLEATAVWTGQLMIVWGGMPLAGDLLADGAAYRP